MQPQSLDSAENVARLLATRSTHFAVLVSAKANKTEETNRQGPSQDKPKVPQQQVAAVVAEGPGEEDAGAGGVEASPTPGNPTGHLIP